MEGSTVNTQEGVGAPGEEKPCDLFVPLHAVAKSVSAGLHRHDGLDANLCDDDTG
jgi:hypothetical protein